MAIIDIVVAVLLLVFGIFGLVKGFARQVLSILSFIFAIVVGFFLLKPVYNLLYDKVGFFASWVNSLGESLKGVNLSFLAELAEKAGKTQGALLSEYIFKAAVFILLAVIAGILFKIVKKILECIVSLPVINVIDRILGVALGFFWVLLIVVILLLIATALRDKVPFLDTFMTSQVEKDGCLVNKFIVANLDKIKTYFTEIFNFLKGFVPGAVEALAG